MQRNGNRRNIPDDVKKYKREFYSKYFGDLSKVIFTVFVVSNAISLIRGSDDNTTDMYLFLLGTFLTTFLVLMANKFIK
ncbi:hypothetical protein Barb7_01169 [Bacteroidales bacterium Barb7]|nr:hypothetical protein Barb7_03029 [Bacteroidales bacterium Barb7]OAV75223.1 hypothetical protein Barb7_01169 [Bacteroidales bacterium Barb7]